MPSCQHSFVIPPPNGPTSTGVCSKCDETREMKNALEADQTWRNLKGERPLIDRYKLFGEKVS